MCIAFLRQPMGRAVHAKLKAAYDGWKASGDDATLVDGIVALADHFGKQQPAEASRKRLCREDLELICFEHVSA